MQLPSEIASGPVRLAAAALAVMRNAAIAAHPHEACGLLFGAPGHIESATSARNVAPEPWHHFEIDPAALFAAQRRHRRGPERLLGCWHSHPGGSPCPSRLDRNGVHAMDWLWLIVANGAVRAFRPQAQGFSEVALWPADR